ncbi:hypothetical protein, partial [Enterococcus lactis]|uniref:hypothetical protein n=1 Tax=Enterococcus lactis TaxID=357441 RepID=UPI00237C19D3
MPKELTQEQVQAIEKTKEEISELKSKIAKNRQDYVFEEQASEKISKLNQHIEAIKKGDIKVEPPQSTYQKNLRRMSKQIAPVERKTQQKPIAEIETQIAKLEGQQKKLGNSQEVMTEYTDLQNKINKLKDQLPKKAHLQAKIHQSQTNKIPKTNPEITKYEKSYDKEKAKLNFLQDMKKSSNSIESYNNNIAENNKKIAQLQTKSKGFFAKIFGAKKTKNEISRLSNTNKQLEEKKAGLNATLSEQAKKLPTVFKDGFSVEKLNSAILSTQQKMNEIDKNKRDAMKEIFNSRQPQTRSTPLKDSR